ncbi:MAG: Hsp33 family molecular chaperone HslO [Alphaproteobacteria bacterium]
MNSSNFDIILPFLIENDSIRGRFSRLDETVNVILSQHQYPLAIGGALCESMALAAILASTLKIDGTFTLQAQGNGIISLLVVNIFQDGKMRAFAKYDEEKLKTAQIKRKTENMLEPTPHLLGGGYLAFTAEQGEERYQGIVALEGNTLAECANKYFIKSEQIDTAIKIAVKEPNDKRGWQASAVMVQKMPQEKKDAVISQDDDDDVWRSAVIFLSSLQDNEMLSSSNSPEEIIYRIYHDNNLKVFEKKHISFGCSCSKERVENTLKTFSKEELADMKEEGKVKVKCQFCSREYIFNDGDL